MYTVTNPIMIAFYATLVILISADVLFKLFRASKADEEMTKKYNRYKYLLENAISYMQDMEFLYDFTEDRDIDWTAEEILYFNISFVSDKDLEEDIEYESEE